MKEIWIQNFESEIERIAEELDLDYEQAEAELKKRLDEDAWYLDGYYTN